MSVEMKIEINEKEKLDAKIPQDEIGHVYDRLAGIYDIWGKLTESRARNRAIELAEIRNGQNILEVAVGTGLAFYEIVKRNPDGINIGVDLSKGMLKKAENRLRKIQNTNLYNVYNMLISTTKSATLFNNSTLGTGNLNAYIPHEQPTLLTNFTH